MNTTKPTTTASSPTKTETKSLDVKPPVDKTVHREIDKKSFLSHSKVANNAKVEIKTIEIQAKKYKKKAKNVKVKIIRDSFPFPEKDYVILSELKKVCIADGLPVKRGEILRTGLQLLTKLTLPELKLALEKVEKIPTRPAKTSKNYVTKH